MNRKVREFQAFFYGQNFFDGIRTTVGVLLPALVFSLLGHLPTGITMSLGAVGASLADTPGPLVHKRNGMLAAIGFCTLSAAITGFANVTKVTLGLEIFLFSFLCSMLLVYGMRASLIGLAALLVMVLTMDHPMAPAQVLLNAGLVLAGGVWYLFLSLLSSQILPYRPAQQAVGEAMLEVAKFLRIKASFYKPVLNQETEFRKLVAQQVLVNEKQDAARELLYKTRQMVKESTDPGRRLVLAFVDLVDLYEQVTAIQYDYSAIRETFGPSGILTEVSGFIENLADELDNIGFAMQANLQVPHRIEFTPKLEHLKNQIDAFTEQNLTINTLVLKRILVNLRAIAQRLTDLYAYTTAGTTYKKRQDRPLEFRLFVSHQSFSYRLLLSNITFKSSVFRFSLRVALVALFSFVLTDAFPYGKHSYWVLLTVIIILKPAFSLTKQRNVQRIIGTVVGGALGLLVLYLVQNETLQFLFLLVFMTGYYSLQRTNYVLSVILMTPFVLILFSFLGGGGVMIVQERIIDTVVGCAIAFTATYFIFPNWESNQVQQFLLNVMKANLRYLQVLTSGLAGQALPEVQYKLARKEVYVNAANLSAAFQRMTAEPKSKQRNSKEIYEFVVLSHVLSSYIATIVSERIGGTPNSSPKLVLKPLRRAQNVLAEAIKHLEPAYEAPEREPELQEPTSELPSPLSPEDHLLAEQVEFIRKVAADLYKLTESMQPSSAIHAGKAA